MALRHTDPLWQYRGHKLITPPAVEPVTANELRSHVKEGSAGLTDADANAMIAAAREYIEQMTGLAMISQTWLMSLDRWPDAKQQWWDGVREGSMVDLHAGGGGIDLPRFPLLTVDGVNVYDQGDNATAVVVADSFHVDIYRTPGRIALKDGVAWPVAARSTGAIEITYTAGYGTEASDVPYALRRAIMQMAAYLYAHAGDCSTGNAYSLSGAADMVRSHAVKKI